MRTEDISGVSGTGVIAEGCQFHTGECMLVWFGKIHTTNRYDSIEDLIAIHGHEGRTYIEWKDGQFE